MLRWLVRVVCCGLMGLLPLLCGAGGLTLPMVALSALLLTACAALAAFRERACATVAAALFGVSCLLLWARGLLGTPAVTLPPIICAVAGGLILPNLPPARSTVHRGALWAALCAAWSVCALLCFIRLPEGLSTLLTPWSRTERGAQQLCALYVRGLLRADIPSAEEAGILLFGPVCMTEDTVYRLTCDLTRQLEALLRAYLPGLLVTWTGVTGVGYALLREVENERLGLWRDLPRWPSWHLPRGWGLAVGALFLGWLLYLGEGSVAMLGALCVSAASFAFGVQGASSLWWRMGQADLPNGTRALAVGALALFLPPVLTVLGVFDQLSDPRGLRTRDDEDDEDEDDDDDLF